MAIAAKIGCAPRALDERIKTAEVDRGMRGGLPTDMAGKMKALERGSLALYQASGPLRKTSACFAMAEFGRRSKGWPGS